MAIGKIIKGNHFGAAITYLLGEGREPRENSNLIATPDEWIASGYEKDKRARVLQTNLIGTNHKQWKKEFEAMGSLREGKKLKDPMRHITFSLKPDESFTTERWQETAEGLLEKLGYKNSPYLIVQHRDRSHDHIHIITSRIAYDGKTVSDSFEKDKLRTFARDVERQHNLTKTPQRANKKTKTKSETELVKRTGEPTVKEQIQAHIDKIKSEKHSAIEFTNELKRQDVFFKPRIQQSGRVVGASFAKADKEGRVWAFKGSDLGNDYKWGELAKQIDYIPERDVSVFVEAKKEAEFAMRGEIMRPVSATAEPSPSKKISEQPHLDVTPLNHSTVKIRPLNNRAERETAIDDLIFQHKREAQDYGGAELTYKEQKRLTKFYRESGNKPPVEKQLARLTEMQKRFVQPLPHPRDLLDASMLTLDNLNENERKELLRQQIKNIKDLTRREGQEERAFIQSNQQRTPLTNEHSTNEQKTEKEFLKRVSEAQERKFITETFSERQIQLAVKQVQVADMLQQYVKKSLDEQGIKLEPLTQRIIDSTIDSWAKQSVNNEEFRSLQDIRQSKDIEVMPETKLEAKALLFVNSDEKEQDKISADLASAAYEKAEEIRAARMQEKEKTAEIGRNDENYDKGRSI